MRRHKPTIKDIADATGVSIATVSRVLNGKGRYSKETEIKVLQTAKDMNYVTNVAAKQLKTRQTNYIGVLVPDITNEFFAETVKIIQLELMKKGYTTFVCNTNEDPEIESEHLDMLREQNVAGIIYVSGMLPWEQQQLNVPLVFVDRRPIDGNTQRISLVESDNRQGSKLAVAALYSKGCQRIACLTSAQRLSTHEIRYRAYLESLQALELPAEPSWHLQAERVAYNEARETVGRALEEGLDVDAIYCTSDWLAVGATDALHDHGIRVPEDVSVIGFDDISVARFRALPLTTIRQDREAMGLAAVRILLDQLENRATKPAHEIIPVQLIERATTR